MPAIITKGAFSAQGYGFGASAATGATYIEDVFSTYLYPGNSSTQTITNNIDLSTKGGMVWIKVRDTNYGHRLTDSSNSFAGFLDSATTNLATNWSGSPVFQATSSGFSLNGNFNQINVNTVNYASWTFRKQPKFFDIVTYTGTGSATTIAHNLGSTPGMIIVKRTDAAANWAVYHNSLTSASYYLSLNTTTGQTSDTTVWNGTAPTSSVFSVGTSTLTNASGGTYVAYIYAHNAGGFGAAGTDNVISCGTITEPASGTATANLGWEPQYLLIKPVSESGNWFLMDIMRSWSNSTVAYLYPNGSGAELGPYSNFTSIPITPTGFQINAGWYGSGVQFIYMAIRRGPMKTPTDATKVFSPNATSATTGTTITTNFPVDLQIMSQRAASGKLSNDRLRGISTNTTESSAFLNTTSADAENTGFAYTLGWDNLGFKISSPWSGVSSIYWNFRRAPGFLDEVCYTGTGSATTVTHNLGVVPELMIVKQRDSGTRGWPVYSNFTGNSKALVLNDTVDTTYFGTTSVLWNSTSPTSTSFSVGTYTWVNGASGTYVAYLFASCPGVSKVGSYTGTGAAQNIDCGFAASARFILIKRTDSTGDWYVYDSARGISASNDPYLLLNSTAAEVTNTNYVGTYASGFALTSTAPAGLNANGGSYIFLAVA